MLDLEEESEETNLEGSRFPYLYLLQPHALNSYLGQMIDLVARWLDRKEAWGNSCGTYVGYNHYPVDWSKCLFHCLLMMWLSATSY